MILRSFLLVGATLALFSSCSSSNKEALTKDVQTFILTFEKSLSASDDQILSYFNTTQSKESLLAAIRVMQNRDMKYMTCETRFNSAIITFEDHGIRALIPAHFYTKDLDEELRSDTELILWIAFTDGKFSITQLEAKKYYDEYTSFRSGIEWQINGKMELADRSNYFAKAKELQQTYDTTIWYVHHAAQTFYYVVNGHWNNYFLNSNENSSKPTDCAMGLVNELGKVIIPVEFDIVGTPGMFGNDLIEVTKSGKVGFYNLKGELIASPIYEWIIPYDSHGAQALAKKDTTLGWLDSQYAFHAGFPANEAEAYFKNYKFLPDQFTISNQTQSLAEIPTEEYVAYGIVIPPTYLVHMGVLDQIEHGYAKNDILNRAFIEYKTTNYSFIENAIDQVSAIVATFTERYLEGREEFYKSNQVIFVNAKRDTVATKRLPIAGDVSFKKIGDILEIRSAENPDDLNGYYGPDEGVWNMPQYSYFQLDENFSLTPLKSMRQFDCTEFAKLDSSYLQGEFVYYNPEKESKETSTFLPDNVIASMRNEILAVYGFTFQDSDLSNEFKYRKWYSPRYTRYEELWETMDDIDKHNVTFLETFIGTLDPQVSVVVN